MAHPPTPAGPQAGITNRPPEHVIVACFRVEQTDPAEVRATFEDLRRVERAELRSDLDDQGPDADRTAPSADRAHLTITTGFGSSAYDKLGVTADQRPQDLIPIPWAMLGDAPVQTDQGDLVLQVCSDDAYVCEHAVRRVEEELGPRLTLLWTQIGSQRYTTRQGRTSRSEGRAVTGFIDGTSNLDPRHNAADAQLVFVDPDAVTSYPQIPVGNPPGYGGTPGSAFPPDLRNPPLSEPASARYGTYMTVRSSTVDTGGWDKTTLGEQEQTVGRFKFSGASLDLTDDPRRLHDRPAFEADQTDVRVPVDSHARKANPLRPDDATRRFFRRGYPLIAGSTAGFDRGLLLIAFGRSISTQFEFAIRAWMRNVNFPLPDSGVDRIFRFEKQVNAGGYYFVPPLERRTQPWSWIVPE